MRHALTTLIATLIATLLFAQTETCTSLKDSFDKVTGQKYSMTDNFHVKGSLDVSFLLMDYENKQFTIMYLKAHGSNVKCVDKEDKIYVLFRDSSRLTLYNEKAFNCNGEGQIMFGQLYGKEKNDWLVQMATKPIETIRMVGRGNIEEEDFTTGMSADFMDMMKCVSGKTKSAPSRDELGNGKKKKG